MEFVGCDELRAAVHRAFASWADNHALISFTDVTQECAKIRALHKDCPLAELWITSLGSEPATVDCSGEAGGSGVASSLQSGGTVAERQATDSSTAATAVPHACYASDFVSTNGRAATSTVIQTNRATLSFNPSLCWYLDSTFCSFFHELKQHASPETVLMAGRLTIFGVWGLCVIVVAVQLTGIIQTQCKAHKNLRARCSSVVGAVAKWSVLGTMLRLILLVAPPIFFQLIFLPCFECYDFEAAATHEVGHVLGLSHPDTLESSAIDGVTPGQNVYHAGLAAAGRMDDSRCMSPWSDVHAGVPPGTPTAVRPSIMMAFTQHNPNVCLSADDVEGLHVLYPDCEMAISEPVCFKFKHNIGWVRLGVYILFPVLLCLLFLMLLNSCVRQHQTARLKSAKDLLGVRKVELDKARRDSLALRQRAEDLQHRYDRQKATEARRVEHQARRLSAQMVEQGRLGGGGGGGGGGVHFSPQTSTREKAAARREAPARAPTTRFGAAMQWMSDRITRQSSDHSPHQYAPECAPDRSLAGGDTIEAGPEPERGLPSPRPVARQGTKLTLTRHGALDRESSRPLVEDDESTQQADESSGSAEEEESSELPELPSHVIPPLG